MMADASIWRVPVSFSQRVLPGLAGAQRQHGARTSCPASVLPKIEHSLQRALEPGRIAQRLVELELQDERQEVARVRRVAGDVVLRTRIEVLFAARHRRRDTPWYFSRSSHQALL